MKRSIFLSIILLITLLIIGCSSQSNNVPTKNPVPATDIPVEGLNQKLKVSAPTGWNNFDTKRDIVLLVAPASNEKIVFNPYNVRIFLIEENSWVELRNKAYYVSPPQDYILDPANKDPLLAVGSSMISPDLPDATKEAQLRIYVYGFGFENDAKNSEKYWAYVDITLKPK